MAESFEDVLSGLVKRCPAVQAAGFMDIDGAEIACVPRGALERLKSGAAFSGIALRRLGTAEKAAGRQGVHHFDLSGKAGRLMAFPVGDNYQLILVVGAEGAPGLLGQATEAVRHLEAGI
jgi:predicted regulator of Ras-like GTPase activity (Roadblock/LC7/MglB family)